MAKIKNPQAKVAQERERATAHFNSGRLREAEVLFRQMLAKNRNDVYAAYHIVGMLYPQRRHAEGVALMERAVAVAPAFAPCWYALGVGQQALGRYQAAADSYERAMALQPDYVDAILNSGVVMRELFRPDVALERFKQVLLLSPDDAGGLGNCATLLSQMGQPENAIPLFRRLVQLHPNHPHALGMLCYERLRACDWTDLAPLTAAILEGVRARRPVCRSFALMALPSTAEDQLHCSSAFAERFPTAQRALWQGEVYAHQRLRVAYVSPDFREHPVTHLMSGVFERHDRSRFETIAIAIGMPDASRFRSRLVQAFDRFVDMAGQGGLEVARRIREMEVDILVDLAGYTQDASPDIFAHRPAPIQVNYLGFPGTTGSSHHDVILADRHVIPPEHQPFYSEKVVYLPDTYLPTDSTQAIAEHTPTRADCGLPETGAVLCAFSHNFKIHPQLFGVWMRLLQQLPGSVLWLAAKDGPMQANLHRSAIALGVDPQRLVFARRVTNVEDHLARYRLADLFLDTTPYNAHTTAADALMAGLPVVTLQGDAFPARVASSLLHAIGLPDLVTQTFEDYEALVLRLVNDPQELADLKTRLRANRQTHPLFDTDRFCRHLEAAYLSMQSAQAAPVAGVPAAARQPRTVSMACAPSA